MLYSINSDKSLKKET